MGEAKIFKEYLKGDIDEHEEFKWIKLDDMFGNLYMDYRRSSLFVNKSATWKSSVKQNT